MSTDEQTAQRPAGKQNLATRGGWSEGENDHPYYVLGRPAVDGTLVERRLGEASTSIVYAGTFQADPTGTSRSSVCAQVGRRAAEREASKVLLSHRNVVEVVGFCTLGDIVMEWHGSFSALLEGGSSRCCASSRVQPRPCTTCISAGMKEDNIVLGCTCHHPNKFQICKRPPAG
jgi:hypothetical protein